VPDWPTKEALTARSTRPKDRFANKLNTKSNFSNGGCTNVKLLKRTPGNEDHDPSIHILDGAVPRARWYRATTPSEHNITHRQTHAH
jgi:hypothetical protein